MLVLTDWIQMKFYICIYVQGVRLLEAISDQNDKTPQIPGVVKATAAQGWALASERRNDKGI